MPPAKVGEDQGKREKGLGLPDDGSGKGKGKENFIAAKGSFELRILRTTSL